MSDIIDCSVNTACIHLPAIKGAGIKKVIRYLDPIGHDNPKVITPAEAAAIRDAGLQLGLVKSEGWGNFAHGGISAGAGERDAQWALQCLQALEAPSGAAVFFTVDTDASESQVVKLVLPYCTAISATFGSGAFQWGIYGSGLVCESVQAKFTLALTWLACSLGWQHSQEFLASKKWSLRQYVPRCSPASIAIWTILVRDSRHMGLHAAHVLRATAASVRITPGGGLQFKASDV